jgi:hypothetical protein
MHDHARPCTTMHDHARPCTTMHDQEKSTLPEEPPYSEDLGGFRESTLQFFKPEDAAALRQIGKLLHTMALEGHPYYGTEDESLTEREMDAGLADLVEVRDVFWNIGRSFEASSLHPPMPGSPVRDRGLPAPRQAHLDCPRGAGLMPGMKRVTTFCVRVEVDRAKRWEAVSRSLDTATVGVWLATLATEKVRQIGKLVPHEPLKWHRGIFRATMTDLHAVPIGTVTRRVSGWLAGVFGIYRSDRDFTLVHAPTGRQLCTLPPLRDCKAVARQLAALRKMEWNETDPDKVVGDDGPSARAIIEQARRASGERHPML